MELSDSAFQITRKAARCAGSLRIQCAGFFPGVIKSGIGVQRMENVPERFSGPHFAISDSTLNHALFSFLRVSRLAQAAGATYQLAPHFRS
jgi:hypothetical protein